MDALVAAVTGKLARGALRSLPEVPERDSTGLPMEIVYYGRLPVWSALVNRGPASTSGELPYIPKDKRKKRHDK